MNYPSEPGYAKHSETSRAAADRLSTKDILYGIILNYLENSCIYLGATVDEAKEACESQSDRTYDRSTIAARFTELEAKGMIVATEETRLTPRNRRATVYVHKNHAPANLPSKAAKTSVRTRYEIELLQKYQGTLSLLREMDEYLDTSPSTSIYSRSIFHRQIKEILKGAA